MARTKKVITLDVPDQVVLYEEKPAEIVLDGNQEVVTDKKMKKALLQAEKQAAKPKTVAKPKAKKVPSPNARILTVDGQKQTIHGHRLMTPEIALEILKRQEKAEKAGSKLDRKALSAEINIAVGTIADVLSGQPVIVKMLAKTGYQHPHPRNENGPRVGKPKQVKK